MKHKLILGVVISAAVLTFTGLENNSAKAGNLLTGSFTEAETPEPITKAKIEKVEWKFGDGETASGMITKKNLAPGTHNVTITIIRSNGENETFEKQIKVEE